jgi:hypothetical protein
VWQYEFRDCYMKNVETDEYAFSHTFRARTVDMSAWTMGPDFFMAYPELRAYIPPRNQISQSITASVPESSDIETQRVTEVF